MDDLASKWALRIAQETAPDGVDLAPVMAQAFLSGKKQREGLLRQSQAGVQGAFSAEPIVVLFPYILEALRDVGPYLQTFLEAIPSYLTGAGTIAGVVSQLLGAANALLTIGRFRNREAKKESLPAENAELARIQEHYNEFKKINVLLRTHLHERGLDEEQADIISYQILKVMLEDPAGAARFTKEVSAAS